MITRVKRPLQWSVVGMVCALCTETFAQDVLYHGTPLPVLPGHPRSRAFDVNDRGEVVGQAEWPLRPFLWDSVQGSLINLGTLPGGSEGGSARAINALGYVVGVSGSANGCEAFLWNPNSGKMIGLGDLPGGRFTSGAVAINNLMQVAGAGQSATQTSEAFLWTAENGLLGLGDLPGGDFQSVSAAINDSTQIVGMSRSANGSEAFIWDPVNGMIGLGNLPGGGFWSYAHGINNAGQVVGESDGEAFLWDPQQGMIGLGFLPPDYFLSRAYDINDAGQVVGTSARAPAVRHAFIWDAKNGMRDLNDFLDAAGREFRVAEAIKISNRGEILVEGRTDGRADRLLLTPFVLADMNCDDAVNAADVDPFFLALVDYERYEVQYPSCHGDWAGDINQDARFDAADIDAFFKLLGGG